LKQPDAATRDLLALLLCPPQRLEPLWKAWAARIPVDSLSGHAVQFLALLYQRLAEAGVEAGVMDRYRVVRRRQFCENQVFAAAHAALLDRLRAEGIPALVGGAPALLSWYGGDASLRPMPDIEITVGERAAARARALIAGMGYTRLPAKASERYLAPAAGIVTLVTAADSPGATRLQEKGELLAAICERSRAPLAVPVWWWPIDLMRMVQDGSMPHGLPAQHDAALDYARSLAG